MILERSDVYQTLLHRGLNTRGLLTSFCQRYCDQGIWESYCYPPHHLSYGRPIVLYIFGYGAAFNILGLLITMKTSHATAQDDVWDSFTAIAWGNAVQLWHDSCSICSRLHRELVSQNSLARSAECCIVGLTGFFFYTDWFVVYLEQDRPSVSWLLPPPSEQTGVSRKAGSTHTLFDSHVKIQMFGYPYNFQVEKWSTVNRTAILIVNHIWLMWLTLASTGKSWTIPGTVKKSDVFSVSCSVWTTGGASMKVISSLRNV